MLGTRTWEHTGQTYRRYPVPPMGWSFQLRVKGIRSPCVSSQSLENPNSNVAQTVRRQRLRSLVENLLPHVLHWTDVGIND